MDYWRVLGVEPGSSIKEVKRVYRQRAKKEHPDVNKSPDALQRWRHLSDAYGKLTDPLYRRQWEEAQNAQKSRKEAYGSSGRSSYASPGRSSGSSYTESKGSRSTGPRSQGFPQASKWAAAGWDAIRDLLIRAEKLRTSTSTGESVAMRESRAARLELERVQQNMEKLRQDEARFLDLTEQFKRSGQKSEELNAGKRRGKKQIFSVMFQYAYIRCTL